MHQRLLLLALFAASALSAAPPAMTPSTSTVTVSSAATIAFPSDRQILQAFTAATRDTTAPIALGQCGLETDTGLVYVAIGTSPGQWLFDSSAWRSAVDLSGYVPLTEEGPLMFAHWLHGDGTDVQLTSTATGGAPLSVDLNNLAAVPSASALVTLTASQTLTNKALSGASNTFSAIPLTSAVTGILPVANGGTGAASLPTVAHYTPTGATVAGHLAGIDSALASAGSLPTNAQGVLLNDGSGSLSWRGTSTGSLSGTANAADYAAKVALFDSSGWLGAGALLLSDAAVGGGQAQLTPDTLSFVADGIGTLFSITLPLPLSEDPVELQWSANSGGLISTGDLPNLDAASLGSGAAASGRVPTADGAGGIDWLPISGAGLGDVSGPASATDGVPALFDGTTGKLLKNSTPTGTGAPVLANSPTLVSPDLGQPSAAVLTYATGLPAATGITGQVPIANGGTGTTTAASAFTALAPSQSGNSGKFLTTNGSAASWAALSVPTIAVAVATTDQSTTATTLTDVTGFSCTLDASSTYTFEVNLVTISANSTEALGVGFSGPSGNSFESFTLLPTTNLGGLIYSYNTATDSTAMHSAGVNVVAPTRIFGRITTGGTGGTFKLQFRAETGSYAVTIRAGSGWRVTKVQ